MSVLLRWLFLHALTSSFVLFVFALGLRNCSFSDALASYFVPYKLAPPFLSHGLMPKHTRPTRERSRTKILKGGRCGERWPKPGEMRREVAKAR